ncbi:hypothetical protein BJF78_28355 [Pseudonocardia sp. CNS-139]|nr:hypothetical protein BJF78_28355 [Pseudonocardia sp. CNS-139]
MPRWSSRRTAGATRASALVDAINEAQAQRAAAQAELDGAPAPTAVTDAEVYAMVDGLGDVGAALKDTRPESLERLYRELRLDARELARRTNEICAAVIADHPGRFGAFATLPLPDVDAALGS